MNFSLLDPFRIGFPNHVDTILYSKSENHPTIVKFSRLGNYLAVGSSHGHVSILITNNPIPIIRLLTPENEKHGYPVSSLSFSYDSQYLAVGHEDGYVAVWDLLESKVFRQLSFENSILQVEIYPWKKKKLLVLADRMDPIVVDLEPDKPTLKDLKVNPEVLENIESKRWCDQLFDYTSAAFDSTGKYLALGTNKGLLAIVELPSHNFIHIERNARTTIRQIKELMLNCKSFIKILEMSITEREPGQQVKLTFSYPTKYSNHSEGGEWLQCCYDHSGDYVVGCYDLEKSYKIYIWERLGGELHSTLEVNDLGRKVHEIAWHPLYPILASLTSHDELWIWSPKFYQKWSGYSNKFTELTTNLIVMENEDEYDLPYASPSHKIHNLEKSSPVKQGQDLNDIDEPDVDIETLDNPYGFNTFNDDLGDHDQNINLTFEHPLILKLKDQLDSNKLKQPSQDDIKSTDSLKTPTPPKPIPMASTNSEPLNTQKESNNTINSESKEPVSNFAGPLSNDVTEKLTPIKVTSTNLTRPWQRELSVSPTYSDRDRYNQRYPPPLRSPPRSPTRYRNFKQNYMSPGYRSPGYDDYPSYRRDSPGYHGERFPANSNRLPDLRLASRSPSPSLYYNKERVLRYSPTRRLPPHPRFIDRRRYMDEREDLYYRDYPPPPIVKGRLPPLPARGPLHEPHSLYDPYYDSQPPPREPPRERDRDPLPPPRSRLNDGMEMLPKFENSYRPGRAGAKDDDSSPVTHAARFPLSEKERYRARYEDRYDRYDRYDRFDRYNDRYEDRYDRFNDRYEDRYTDRFDSYVGQPRNPPYIKDQRDNRFKRDHRIEKDTPTDGLSERKSSGANENFKVSQQLQPPPPPNQDNLTIPVPEAAEGSEEGEIVE